MHRCLHTVYSIPTSLSSQIGHYLGSIIDRRFEGQHSYQERKEDKKSVNLSSPIPGNWQEFLRVDANKEELFRCMAKMVVVSLRLRAKILSPPTTLGYFVQIGKMSPVYTMHTRRGEHSNHAPLSRCCTKRSQQSVNTHS